MPKYYVVTVNTFDRPVPYAAIKDVLDKLKDWARFAPQSWLVWTELDSDALYPRFRAVLNQADHVFIIKADMSDRMGWIPTATVDWLSAKRQTDGE